VKGTSQARVTGLVAVRIAWITAIAVCALAILIGLLTGTGTGDPSRQLPGFAFSAGRDSSHQSPGFTWHDPAAAMAGAAAQKDRSRWAKEGAPGDSHSGSRIPPRSGSQPEDTGGRAPVITPRPKPPQAPGGDPAGAPQTPSVGPPTPPKPPKPPQAPPEPTPAPPVTPPEPTPAPPVTPPEPPKPPKSPKPPKPPKP
jgi:hypothetical protein